MRRWLPYFLPILLGGVFLLASFAELPKNLDRSEQAKQEFTEIELPSSPPESKPPEPEPAAAPDPLADLAPESLSADASVQSSFGLGFGEGGGPAGGSGGLNTDAGTLVGEKTSVDRPARVLQRSAPEYPAAARNKGISGTVTVKILIAASGSVEDAKVENATPPGVFEESALRAVRSWRFEPAMQKGKAVTAWLSQKIRYELN
jgi:protein TonB